MILFNKETLFLIDYLSKQIILPNEEKRDETIHKEIYDLINAFEMSCSMLYQYQYSIQNKITRLRKENDEF